MTNFKVLWCKTCQELIPTEEGRKGEDAHLEFGFSFLLFRAETFGALRHFVGLLLGRRQLSIGLIELAPQICRNACFFLQVLNDRT